MEDEQSRPSPPGAEVPTGSPNAEHPLPEPPASDFIDELDHAARVTEEAAMDIPSPPFSSCREGSASAKVYKKNGAIRRVWTDSAQQ